MTRMSARASSMSLAQVWRMRHQGAALANFDPVDVAAHHPCETAQLDWNDFTERKEEADRVTERSAATCRRGS